MNEKLTEMCRLCLQSGAELQNFFCPKKNFVALVEQFTGLKISQRPNFPENVCSHCIVNIETLNSFKRKCLESEEVLCRDLLIDQSHSVAEPGNEIKPQATDGLEESNVEPTMKTTPKRNQQDIPLAERNTTKARRKKSSTQLTPCYVCGKLYQKHVLKFHLNKHTGDRPYVCPLEDCAKTFPSPSNLASHYNICHTDRFRFTCDVCGSHFKVKTTFDIHRSYHFDPELPCSVCGKLLRHQRALKKHMMSHTGERPFQCNICSKSFQTRYTLRIHQRVHTKEKPFTCEICAKSFSYSCVLKTHMLSFHRAAES